MTTPTVDMALLSKMSVRQLQTHRAAYNQALDQAVATKQAEVRERISRIAEEADLTLDSLRVISPKPANGNHPKPVAVKTAVAKPAVKQAANRTAKKSAKADIAFRDPANPKHVWGGRGPRPRWLREKIAAGAKLEQFKAA